MSPKKVTSQVNNFFLEFRISAVDPKGLWLSQRPSQLPQLSQITLSLHKFYEGKCKQLKTYPSTVILVTLGKTTTPPAFMFPLYLHAQQGKDTLLILPRSTSNSLSYLISWKTTLTIHTILMKFSTLSSQSLAHHQPEPLYQSILHCHRKHSLRAKYLWSGANLGPSFTHNLSGSFYYFLLFLTTL
jgi:hypothetical protein